MRHPNPQRDALNALLKAYGFRWSKVEVGSEDEWAGPGVTGGGVGEAVGHRWELRAPEGYATTVTDALLGVIWKGAPNDAFHRGVPQPAVPPPPGRRYRYSCDECGNTWNGVAVCPTCGGDDMVRRYRDPTPPAAADLDPAAMIAEVVAIQQGERSYPVPLPSDLAPWYCYPMDSGHSILAIPNDASLARSEGSLVPIPVKTVLRGYSVEQGFIVATHATRSPTLGLVAPDEDTEY